MKDKYIKLFVKSSFRIFSKFSNIGVCVLLASCAVGPDYEKPKIDLPKNLASANEVASFTAANWWKVFLDVNLDKLEKLAIEKNLDIQQAIANLDEAHAALDIANANFFPTIGVNTQGLSTLNSQKSMNLPDAAKSMMPRHNQNFKLGAVVSYEVDLFGKYTRASESAVAVLLATKAAKDIVLLTVTSEVAKTYFLLRSLDAKLAIASRALEIRNKSYELYKLRMKNGYSSELDLKRIEAERAVVESSLFDIKTLIAKTETALSVLIGASPREIAERKIYRSSSLEALAIPVTMPSNIPSDFLKRRPDIEQSEQSLIAANAKIGEALSAHFPTFSLTGGFGYESLSLSNMFSNGAEAANILGSIAIPVFSGGKIDAAAKIAEARYNKALANYKKTLQIAFKEALDAIVCNRLNNSILKARNSQVKALKKAYTLAKFQNKEGLIGLIDLLDVERGLLSAEIDLASAHLSRLNSVVDLCKALGGGYISK